MPTYLPKPSASFELPPAGTHVARFSRVIDLGTQRVTYNGETELAHKILVTWELGNETTADGKPVFVSKRYTLSTHPKSTLRKDLEGCRGKQFADAELGEGGFDIHAIVNAPCHISVVHAERNGTTFANVASVLKLAKGVTAPPLKSTPVFLWLTKDGFSAQIFGTLSENLQAVIKASPEYGRLMNDGPDESDLDDDCPF